MNIALVLLMLVFAGCEPEDREPEGPPPPPEYVPCAELGARRYEGRFCVHAEHVRVEDYTITMCPDVDMNPAPELYARIDDEIRRQLARENGWDENALEIVNREGASTIATLDVCVRQHPWTAEDIRWRGDRASLGAIDTSRPFRVEVHAARDFSFRGPGQSPRRGAEVGSWPRPMSAPPVEWRGFPSCDELPARLTEDRFCVHDEHVAVRAEPFPVCDRVSVIPSELLLRQIEARVHEHLAIGEHADERPPEIERATAEYVVALDACIVVPGVERQAAGPTPTMIRGGIDPAGPVEVEITQGRFRYRFRHEGPFQDGRIGIGAGAAQELREDQGHE